MSTTRSGPSLQETVIVGSVGLVLLFIGLVALYFWAVLDTAGALNLVGSLLTIGVAGYMLYAAWVGKSWVGAISPESAEKRQEKFKR